MVTPDDHEICHDKPVGKKFVTCNRETAKWEETGPVHAPGTPVCGKEPIDMVQPICDAVSGKWIETKVVADPGFKTCKGMPPANKSHAVCNIETGEWEAGLTAKEAEKKVEEEAEKDE